MLRRDFFEIGANFENYYKVKTKIIEVRIDFYYKLDL